MAAYNIDDIIYLSLLQVNHHIFLALPVHDIVRPFQLTSGCLDALLSHGSTGNLQNETPHQLPVLTACKSYVILQKRCSFPKTCDCSGIANI